MLAHARPPEKAVLAGACLKSVLLRGTYNVMLFVNNDQTGPGRFRKATPLTLTPLTFNSQKAAI